MWCLTWKDATCLYARRTGSAVRQYLTCVQPLGQNQILTPCRLGCSFFLDVCIQESVVRTTIEKHNRFSSRVKLDCAFQARGKLEYERKLLEQPAHAVQLPDAYSTVGKILVDTRRRFCARSNETGRSDERDGNNASHIQTYSRERPTCDFCDSL